MSDRRSYLLFHKKPLVEAQGLLLVAVSGGADSVALLRLLHAEGHQIQALHCNFHLRGEESDRDEHFVTELCQKLQVTLHIRHFDTQAYATQQGLSIEMAARELRYQWFEEMRQKLDAKLVCVAHHQEDQAETLLLNLIRGTGLRGLAGMSKRSGYISRPLLTSSKAEILTYLEEIGQDYVTDSSNLLRDAQRNRVRLDIIPLLRELNPKAVEHIAQAAAHVAEAIPYYIKGVDCSADELSLSTLHERLQGMGFTSAQEEQMEKSRRTGAIFESPTHRAVFNRGKLVVEPKQADSLRPSLRLNVTETTQPMELMARLLAHSDLQTCAYLDADKINVDSLTLRHPQTGDRFQPYGMEGRTRLLSDFLTDLKLNRFEKEQCWLVCQGDEIVWVAGLRTAHRFRVTPQTRRILTVYLA